MKYALLLSILFVVTACENTIVVDDQKMVRKQEQILANPVPRLASVANFERNNRRHRVLVGVFDSGVDYTHPNLVENMHFDLNTIGFPSGCGYDFAAEDHWASPYVVRTEQYRKGIDDFDRMMAEKEGNLIRKQLLSVEPRLARWIEPRRHITQEKAAKAAHGTHVSGLIVNGRDDIGIVPYRVLPLSKSRKKNYDYNARFVNNFVRGIDMAKKKGVKIINASLGSLMRKKESASAEARTGIFEAERLYALIGNAMRNAPDILFIVAAGNDGAWVDDRYVRYLPCGIKSRNVLCVGALGPKLSMAMFSNLPLYRMNIIFAEGENLESTMPMDYCEAAAHMVYLNNKGDYPKKRVPSIYKQCKKESGFARMSGTSMATPMVAHVASIIAAENPGLTPFDIMTRLKKKARTFFVGFHPYLRLKVRKPTWDKTRKIPESGDFLEGIIEAPWRDYTWDEMI